MLAPSASPLDLNVSRETSVKLSTYVDMLVEENRYQNLIGPRTIESVWTRHVDDSAQLLDLVGEGWTSWLDVGSGGGLPGIVIAILSQRPVTLVEPRRKRADFLSRVVTELSLAAEVVTARVELLDTRQFDVISARAVAPLPALFAMTEHLSRPDTIYVLPKGRTGKEELEPAREAWQGDFTLQPSRTDPDSVIVVGRNVRRRGR